ncbi:MAG: molybdopterin-dependent oxidoreductase [Rhodocyclaceae bacterium]|nr:molybdopterin-dependent oxidoreductase [Rhodocyclaceae bacterium]
MTAITTPTHSEDKPVMCGICEASCGLIATVVNDEVVKLRGDDNHPNSRGFTCPKGVSFGYFLKDPDRVLEPLQKQPDGSFKPVSWDTALDDIGRRLNAIIREHGGEAVGLYLGNPCAWNYGAFLSLMGMAAALKTKHFYTAASIDINNYWAVHSLIYGNFQVNPIPDVHRTKFLVVLGANPAVSHGSMLTVGRVKEAMQDITARGGRVVVIDPRRTETAELFEHVAIRPDSDAWLVAAMLKVVLDEGLADTAALARQTVGADFLDGLVRDVDLARAAQETGIAQTTIVQLARDFAASPAAALYCRTGASMGQFSSLTKYLVDAFNIATGNLDRPGGYVFGVPMVDTEQVVKLFGLAGYDRWRTRVDNLPEIAGTSPLISLPREIETPGKGQLRALMVCSGNIASSGPAAQAIDAALPKLDLLVAMDLFVTETSRHADYILPATTWLERDAWPVFTSGHTAIPYAQWTPAAVTPRGQSRDDAWMLDQICRRIGIVASPLAAAQWAGKLGIRVPTQLMADILLRLSPHGDWFGLKPGGLNRKKLWAKPSGIKLADSLPTGVLAKHIYFSDKRVHLDQPLIGSEMQRLLARSSIDADYPLLVIGMREIRSHNSWMHNVPKLMAGADRTHSLRIHPDDAAARSIGDGDEVEIASRHGSVRVKARVTDEMMPGSVALPHGWGHAGGWQRAVAAGGGRYNNLTGNRPEENDLLSGNAAFSGIRVRVERVDGARVKTPELETAAA